MDEKERFKFEFEETCETIRKNYPTKDGQERELAGVIINTYLHQVQSDAETLDWLDFYRKYLIGLSYLNFNDFTKTEIDEIIKEAPLNTRDQQLARMYWLDMETDENISDRLGIDRKTIRNNMPRISSVLRLTAAKVVRNKK